MLDVNNLVIVADTHVGCQLGLMHPDGAILDSGDPVVPTTLRLKVWSVWEHFWDDWVPRATRGEPYAIVLNGLGRGAEATALIERELAGPRGYSSREREQLLLLKALILGPDSLGGRATLRELVRNGQSREVMAIALQ